MVKRYKFMRAGMEFVKFRGKFKSRIEPLINRKVSDSELTDRIAVLLDEWDVIGVTERRVKRRRRL